MKKLTFITNWGKYKKGEHLETNEFVYNRLISLHKVAVPFSEKKRTSKK